MTKLILMFSFTFMSPLVYADIECKGDPIKQGRYLNKNPPKSWTDCYGEYTYLSGSIYRGSFINGNRHGEGVLKQSNGSYYEGSWHNNKPEGDGLVVTIEPIYYEGMWKDNLFQGVITFPNHDVFDFGLQGQTY